MAKQTQTPETVTVNGREWRKCFLDDGSGHWFETAGAFGELVVEPSRAGTFVAAWCPPGIKAGEAVLISDRCTTRRAAMKACVNYIDRLAKLLAPGLAS